MIARRQLLGLGLTSGAIEHRVRTGRLRRVHRGVYAVGPLELPWLGVLYAATLACGDGAVLSHGSAAAVWGLRSLRGPIELTVPLPRNPRPAALRVRRAALDPRDLARRQGLRLTGVARTIVDLAQRLDVGEIEALVNAADRAALVDPERLSAQLERLARVPGVAAVREVIDRPTFTITDSELERRFQPLALAVGLPAPQTQVMVNGIRHDFFWPGLGLVVETDGLHYHRTPSQQARDRIRDQAHFVAGLTPLRFTRAQVVYDDEYVRRTLSDVVDRLRHGPGRDAGAMRRS